MQLIAWLVVALVLSVTCSRRLWIPIGTVIVSTMFIPVIASGVLVGSGVPALSGLYPSTFFIAILASTNLLLRLTDYIGDIAHTAGLTLIVLLFSAAAALTTYFASGSDGIAFLLNQVVAPAALFFVVRRAMADDARAPRRLALLVIGGATIESVIAILVWSGVVAQPFAENYANYYWYGLEINAGRALGTMDHPLVLSCVLVLAMALLANVRSTLIQASLAVLFLGTILLTQSRTGVLLSLVVILYLLTKGQVPIQARLLISAVFAGAFLVYANSEIGATTADKFTNDGGSGAVRGIALEYVLARANEFLLIGRGPGSDAAFARDAGLGTSLENPFLSYAINYGLILAVLYFAAQLLIPLRSRRTVRAVAGAQIGALTLLLAVQTFSSVSTINVLGVFVWLALAFAAKPLEQQIGQQPSEADPTAGVTGRTRTQAGVRRRPAGHSPSTRIGYPDRRPMRRR